MSTEAMRVAFEAWMVNKAKIIIGSSDPYPKGLERDYWNVWQAATAVERERAALVCDQLGGDIDPKDPDEVMLCANSLAAAIRSGK